jgi:hypothetical protein
MGWVGKGQGVRRVSALTVVLGSPSPHVGTPVGVLLGRVEGAFEGRSVGVAEGVFEGRSVGRVEG